MTGLKDEEARLGTGRSTTPEVELGGAAIPSNVLPSLLSIAESALTVRQLATTELWWADPDELATIVAAEMRARGFDLAPVRQDPPHRFVTLEDLEKATGTVDDIAQTIDISLLLTPEVPLTATVSALSRKPAYFMLETNRLAGVVTRSDLQRPAVSMVLFALILATETALNDVIHSVYGNDFLTHMPAARREKLEEVYRQRRRHNTEISMLDCLMLEDRFALIGPLRDVVRSMGFTSSSSYDRWAERMKALRNVLAHGGGLLDAQKDPLGAIDLFNRVREFAEHSWQMAAAEPKP